MEFIGDVDDRCVISFLPVAELQRPVGFDGRHAFECESIVDWLCNYRATHPVTGQTIPKQPLSSVLPIGFELRSSSAIINLSIAVKCCDCCVFYLLSEHGSDTMRTQNRTAPLLNFNNRRTGFNLLGLFSSAWSILERQCSV